MQCLQPKEAEDLTEWNDGKNSRYDAAKAIDPDGADDSESRPNHRQDQRT